MNLSEMHEAYDGLDENITNMLIKPLVEINNGNCIRRSKYVVVVRCCLDQPKRLQVRKNANKGHSNNFITIGRITAFCSVSLNHQRF